MSLKKAQQILGWPEQDHIMNPTGMGVRVALNLAREKLERSLSRCSDGNGVRVGILTADSESTSTQALFSIVCEFPRKVSETTLRLAHKLAWNFCRAPLLITIEPDLLRSWTCHEPPADPNENTYIAELTDLRLDLNLSLSQQAAQSLHWVNLASGQFFIDYAKKFRFERRADQMLLENLRYLRKRLNALGLEYDVIHDLIARMIFIQFLFDRKDSSGQPALNENVLRKLHIERRVLSREYKSLKDILENYDDSYKFFRWLNDKFSGDLFPGKGATEAEREAEWQAEKEQVKPIHLELLADFVSGKIRMKDNQLFFWERYSFDAIPLEFISSIYEVFVNDKNGQDEVDSESGQDLQNTGLEGKPKVENYQNKSAHYTPGYLVDFMLDGVLPWDGVAWDLKILDPACGSGIFLVKAFQRLVQRWKNANPNDTAPKPTFLRSLLEKNLFGVDIDSHAVRVASFSLYLAICDEIDPRHYWNNLKFPRLRERQVVEADFFEEDEPLFKNLQEEISYDLIIGNAPWGHNRLTPEAQKWANRHKWETGYKDIGPLFLPKAATHLNPEGWIIMIQPISGILSNQVGTSQSFRHRLFEEFRIEEIVNLSALRFGLFSKSISPACIITMRSFRPNGEPFSYVCPKPTHTSEDDYRVVINPSDTERVYPDEVDDEIIWSALMWGGRRDLALIRKLQKRETLYALESKGHVKTRQGLIRGDRKKKQSEIIGRRIFSDQHFPDESLFYLNANSLPKNFDPAAHGKGSTDWSAFELPQMLVKQSWQAKEKRFRAVLVESKDNGILCSGSYFSIHSPDSNILESACLAYNSKIAVYYMLLSSGRLAFYRGKGNKDDLLKIPIPTPEPDIMKDVKNFEDIDKRCYQAFRFNESERILIDDAFNYTLPDFKGNASSQGRQSTCRTWSGDNRAYNEPNMRAYCETLVRVLKSGFGQDKNICATVYRERNENQLPVRLAAIHLDWPDRPRISIEEIDSQSLLDTLAALNKKLNKKDSGGDVLYRRVARIYDKMEWEEKNIPTIYIVKTDQIRYWLRSVAMRDADEITSEILMMRSSKKSPGPNELAA
jgi:type I restriction-modification system DNA methylase subunit